MDGYTTSLKRAKTQFSLQGKYSDDIQNDPFLSQPMKMQGAATMRQVPCWHQAAQGSVKRTNSGTDRPV